MIGVIENINVISSFHAQSNIYRKIQNRKSHAFIFKIDGMAEYNFKEKKFLLQGGQVIFLPQGANYEYTSNGGLYTSINFYADVENPEPCIFSLEDFYGTNFIFESFSNLWRFGALADKYKCISVFYDFLS